MMPERILVVDDEPDLREMLADYLSTHGYEVATVADGQGLRSELARGSPALVILDINLGRESGYELARELAGRDPPPGLLMLTAVGDLEHRLRGLAAGADDYMPKPFEPRELLARVRSVLRRSQAETGRPDRPLRVGRAMFHPQERRLTGPDGAEIPLSAMEFDLLMVFLRHPGQILSRGRLAELAHGKAADPNDRSIDIRITRLRRKIEDEPARPSVLVTIRGEGYRFVPIS